MTNPIPESGLRLYSKVNPEGVLEVGLADVPVKAPAEDEVLIKVDAAPINPSDLALFWAFSDVSKAISGGTDERPVVTVPLSDAIMASLKARVGQALPVGNEGAGVVVASGNSEAARALMGRTVSVAGGSMYAQYRRVKAKQCLPHLEGTTAIQAASSFVNPITVLAMVETMRREGHSALVHTAAASNLGQMLQKVCSADDIPLVNIVRKPEQVKILKDIGATHVCNSSSPNFFEELTEALAATGATLAFDAIGGGKLAGRILSCMEVVASRSLEEYNRYGSSQPKQLYIYGGLDSSPTQLNRNFGFSWGVGGWLLPNFLASVTPDVVQRMQERVAAEISTTFASHYTRELSLADALRPEDVALYCQQATGQKYLIRPWASATTD